MPESWLACDPDSDEAWIATAPPFQPPRGGLHWVGHAHLDLAWLWPVADTWQAAERTFRSLQLMDRDPELHLPFHAGSLRWMERIARIFADSGRQSPGTLGAHPADPGLERLCAGQCSLALEAVSAWAEASRRQFSEWQHGQLAPRQLRFRGRFASGGSGSRVRWFCTHKLAWNANSFPHRLFRWRSRGDGQVLADAAWDGTDADPVAMQQEQRYFSRPPAWIRRCGPGAGDHVGGPTPGDARSTAAVGRHPVGVAPWGTVRIYQGWSPARRRCRSGGMSYLGYIVAVPPRVRIRNVTTAPWRAATRGGSC